MKKIIFILLIAGMFETSFTTHYVFAQTNASGTPTVVSSSSVPAVGSTASSGSATGFQPLTQLPGIHDIAATTSLPNFFNTLYKLCIGAAAVLAVLQIMRAGVLMMTQRGSAMQNEQAKSLIQNSVLGLILVLSPVILFSIINPDILHLTLDVTQLQPTASPSGISTSSLATVGQAGDCSTYSAVKVVGGSQSDPNTLACDTGYSKTPNNCCSLQFVGQICCGQVGATQYLLAYTFSMTPKSGSVPACVQAPTPKYYANQTDCTTALGSLNGYIGAGAENYNYSNLQILQSCVAVTNTLYKIPVSPNACKT